MSRLSVVFLQWYYIARPRSCKCLLSPSNLSLTSFYCVAFRSTSVSCTVFFASTIVEQPFYTVPSFTFKLGRSEYNTGIRWMATSIVPSKVQM